MRIEIKYENIEKLPRSKLIGLMKKYQKKIERLTDLHNTLIYFKIPYNNITVNSIYAKINFYKEQKSNIYWYIDMVDSNYTDTRLSSFFLPIGGLSFLRQQYIREQKLKNIL